LDLGIGGESFIGAIELAEVAGKPAECGADVGKGGGGKAAEEVGGAAGVVSLEFGAFARTEQGVGGRGRCGNRRQVEEGPPG
jgi:hypothetical protein